MQLKFLCAVEMRIIPKVKGIVAGLIAFKFYDMDVNTGDQINLISVEDNDFIGSDVTEVSHLWTIIGQNHLHPNNSNLLGKYKTTCVQISIHPSVRHILIVEKDGIFNWLTEMKFFK